MGEVSVIVGAMKVNPFQTLGRKYCSLQSVNMKIQSDIKKYQVEFDTMHQAGYHLRLFLCKLVKVS